MHVAQYYVAFSILLYFVSQSPKFPPKYFILEARHAGSDGRMSASGSAGPGFDPRRGSKFLFENFQPRS